MCQQEDEGVNPDGTEQDAYDEFEDGVRRVCLFIIRLRRELSASEKVGHGVALLTLAALVFYTAYTIKIYKATNRSAQAAKDAANTAKDALHITERAYIAAGKP